VYISFILSRDNVESIQFNLFTIVFSIVFFCLLKVI